MHALNRSLERAKSENFQAKSPVASSTGISALFSMKPGKKIPPISLASPGPFLVKGTPEKLIN
jgi:hypothetical protein